MATTTNYGWTTPDDTALVKDGAAAIRTLGSSVDTTTKNLNPETTLGDIAYRSSSANVKTRLGIGSTGQVLTVASGVPSWATPSDQVPLTTKGDIFTFSTVDARLAVGTNNYVLTADSAEATGLKWTAPSAGALTKLYAQSFTTSSQVDVDDVFSATYENYLIMINVSASSSSDYIKVRMRVGGSTNSNSDYFWSWMGNASAYPAYDSQGGSAANGFQTFYRGTGQNAYMGIMQMNNPYLSLRTSTNWQWSAMEGSSYNGIQQGGGVFNANTSFTGFSIVPGSGNITGKVAVYGYSI